MMKRILIIDDNPRNNNEYILPLRKYFKVDVIMSLKTAERLIRVNNYEVIVIDIMMPTQDPAINNELETGLQFYKLRLAKLYPQQKILFWSRLTSESYDKFFSVNKPNNVSFLSKDRNDPSHLLNKIRKIV